MIVANEHLVNGKKLVAVCDKVLLGKKFEEGGLQLDLSGSFYKGNEVSGEELENLLKGAYFVNFVGKGSVGFGIKKGLVGKGRVIKVKGVLHAQAMMEGF